MRRLRALIRNLPGDSAFARDMARRPYEQPKPAVPARETSSPATIRRIGGRFIEAPRPSSMVGGES